MTVRVLLWSPDGAGEHYHGPGSFAYRMYAAAPPAAVELELAHARMDQGAYSLFSRQHCISETPADALSLAAYLLRSRSWLRHNARRFDVVHGLTGFHASVVPLHMAQTLGLPTVLFVANHRLEFVDKPGLRGLLGLARARRRKLRRLTAIIAMTRAIYAELTELGVEPSRIARIPMGVDMARFRPPSDSAERRALRAAAGIPDLPTVIFVGGIIERKRPHLLVEAIGHLNDSGLECQLILAGPEHEPSYSQRLRRGIAEHRIEERVHWTGHVRDIHHLLRAADVFALPSSKEGMPAALVEAMASGLPAVVTGTSGCEDLVTHGQEGILVAPEALHVAAAIAEYLRQPALATGHGVNARRRVVDSLSNEVVLGAYLRLFRAVRSAVDPSEASLF